MTSEKDFYFTIEKLFRAPELKVKGSRFIADIFPVNSKDAIESQLSQIKKEFYDATHHCYAYRLGVGAEYIRAADDGEPAGTAGKPILLALTSKELTDTLLVVTRYYGGTNLGTGGLARAYYEAAQLAIDGCKTTTVYLTDTFTFVINYDQISSIERLLQSYDALYTADYGEKITVKVELRKSFSQKFKSEMGEKFYGIILFET
jgi:uncharacterized YigZ family protein